MGEIAMDINILGHFLGQRDIPELTSSQLAQHFGIQQADVMVLFGGSIIAGGDVMAKAIQNEIAKHYVIVGGAGHTTELLRQEIYREYPMIITTQLPEAQIFNNYLQAQYGLQADYLETRSTNCGNNITYLLDLLQSHHIQCENIILTQDATMQLRMAAVLRKYAQNDLKIINYAAYQATVIGSEDNLAYAENIHGMWQMDHYLELLMGEIPRLTDDINGYGPKGKNYLAHVDIPKEVSQAFNDLKQLHGIKVRTANPKFASKGN